jgi:hypothetical protein
LNLNTLDLAPIHDALLNVDKWELKGPGDQALRFDHKLKGVYFVAVLSATGMDYEPSQLLLALVNTVDQHYQTGFADLMVALFRELAGMCSARWALKELDS